MEIKIWEEYTHEEKTLLLNHWWYYYGKMMVTLAEWEAFNNLVKKDADKILDLAVATYVNFNESSQCLILAMRAGRVDELLDSLPNIETEDADFRIWYASAKRNFIEMLVNSYNHPEPDVPMEPEALISQTVDIILSQKQVNK